LSREIELQAIVALLTMLAEQCGAKVSDNRLAFYANELSPHGAVPVCNTLKAMNRSATRFPTVAEIEKAMGVGASPLDTEQLARDTAERIYVAIGKRRAQGWDKAQIDIGDVGVATVELLGGWKLLCETTREDQAPTLKAQWRGVAEITAERMKRGEDLSRAPELAPAATAMLEGMKRANT